MGTFFMMYGRKYCTTILQKITTSPTMFAYQMQSNIDILPNIFSLFLFSHQIEDDKMKCEPTRFLNKKIIKSKIFLWKLDLSLTIIFGFPCSFWVVSMNVAAIVPVLKGCERAQKCAYLVSLSMTTIITLFPLDLGIPMIKSINTSS